jgi:hypothetical protein
MLRYSYEGELVGYRMYTKLYCCNMLQFTAPFSETRTAMRNSKSPHFFSLYNTRRPLVGILVSGFFANQDRPDTISSNKPGYLLTTPPGNTCSVPE